MRKIEERSTNRFGIKINQVTKVDELLLVNLKD